MRALIKMLAAAAWLAMSSGVALAQYASGPPTNPVYPPYPYKAGHYPTADSYYDLPPYAAIKPGFYRWRYFMIGQERNRYRYMPHIFRGYTGYREENVGSYKPMSSTSPPKTEPSPAAPAETLELKKGDTGAPSPPAPDRPSVAPEPSPPAPDRPPGAAGPSPQAPEGPLGTPGAGQ